MTQKKNPLFKGLRSTLKDPANFKLIERQLSKILKSDHEHKTVKSYVTCLWCNEKRAERQKAMKEFGFKSTAQYLEWRKIHGMMIKVRELQHEKSNQKA